MKKQVEFEIPTHRIGLGPEVEIAPTILIAGTSGSGKSTVANAIVDRVLGSGMVLSLDKYERHGSECLVEDDGLINWEDPATRDFGKLEQDIRDLQSGNKATIPVDLTFRNTSPGDVLDITYSEVDPPELLVVEGHLLLGNPRVRSLGTLAVFLHSTDHGERLARRQHASRNPYYEARYFVPGEQNRVLPTRSYANAEIDVAGKSVDQVADEILALANLDEQLRSLERASD